jgi:hypothetical protein
MGKAEGTWKKIVKVTKSLPNSWIVDVYAGEEYGTIFAGRVGVDDRKLFAFVIPSGDEQGVHLRSVDPAVTGDSARFAPSRVFLVTRSNWVRLLPQGEAPSDEALRALVLESHRLTQMRSEGVAPRNEHGDVYAALAKALEAATDEERPPPPFHAGGPMAKLTGSGSVSVAVACAEHVASLVPVGERKGYDRALALARKAVEAAPARKGLVALQDPLENIVGARAKGSHALRAAHSAAAAAALLCRGSADTVWKNTARAAEHAVHALQEKGDPAAVREFIRLLDDWILVAEIVGIDPELGGKAEKNKKEHQQSPRVLWRASNEKGYPVAWLVRFQDGSYGLRHKVGPRCRWDTGARDDVLASVPDAAFERAVAFALDRDGGR